MAPSTIDKYYLFICSASMLACVFYHMVKYRDSNYLRPDTLFLLGFFIVHFQWPLMFSFGVGPSYPKWLWVDKSIVNYSTGLSLVGGVFWLFGFHFQFRRKKKLQAHFTIRLTLPQRSRPFNIKIELLTILTILAFIVFLFFVGKSFLSGVYMGAGNWGGISKYVYVLFSVLIIVTFCAEILNKLSRFGGSFVKWVQILDKRLIILSLIYIALFFYIGDRGGPLQLILAVGCLLAATVRPVKLMELVVIVVVGATLLTFIAWGRTSQETAKGSLITRGIEEFNKRERIKWYEYTVNLANSNRCLFRAVNHVKNKQEFYYGKLFIGNLLGVIPFAQSTYLSVTNDKRYEMSSPNLITYLAYGGRSKSGEGTTVIADIYLNFGLIGVVVLMFVLGKLYSIICFNLKNNINFVSVYTFSVISAFSLYYGRAPFLIWIKMLVWGVIIYLILFKINRFVR